MANIDYLWPFIASWEGGYVNDPKDAGGATNRGVTISTWRSVGYDKDCDGDIDADDLKLITEEDAVERVMRPHYWNKWRADEITSQSLANILVDWLWGSGSKAITIPQQMLGVKADGIVGKQTLLALNSVDARDFFNRLKTRRRQFIANIIKAKPSQKRFEKGWLTRLDYIKFGSLQHNAKTTKIVTFND